MSYDRYKSLIAQRTGACSEGVLEAFCQDIALRIIPFVDRADKSNLWPRELELISNLADMVRHQHPDWKYIGDALQEITKIAEEDEVHAIEIDGDLVEFLSALHNWREVVVSGNKGAAAAVSENIMNILDFHFVENTPLEQWLSVSEIHDELEMQLKFIENRVA